MLQFRSCNDSTTVILSFQQLSDGCGGPGGGGLATAYPNIFFMLIPSALCSLLKFAFSHCPKLLMSVLRGKDKYRMCMNSYDGGRQF